MQISHVIFNEEDEEPYFKITTLFYLQNYFNQPKSLQMAPVFPTTKYSNYFYPLDFNVLSIFKNELHDFTPKHHGFELKDVTFCFHFHINNNMSQQIMLKPTLKKEKPMILVFLL